MRYIRVLVFFIILVSTYSFNAQASQPEAHRIPTWVFKSGWGDAIFKRSQYFVRPVKGHLSSLGCTATYNFMRYCWYHKKYPASNKVTTARYLAEDTAITFLTGHFVHCLASDAAWLIFKKDFNWAAFTETTVSGLLLYLISKYRVGLRKNIRNDLLTVAAFGATVAFFQDNPLRKSNLKFSCCAAGLAVLFTSPADIKSVWNKLRGDKEKYKYAPTRLANFIACSNELYPDDETLQLRKKTESYLKKTADKNNSEQLPLFLQPLNLIGSFFRKDLEEDVTGVVDIPKDMLMRKLSTSIKASNWNEIEVFKGNEPLKLERGNLVRLNLDF